MSIKRLDAIFLVLAILIVGSACAGEPKGTQTKGGDGAEQPGNGTEQPAASEEVRLHTSDGHTIVGTLVSTGGETGIPACLLAHQLGRDRETYAQFQQVLADKDITTLAIDLRGHGASTDNGTFYFRNFTRPEEWQAMVHDFEAALGYLRSIPGVDPGRIGIVGASIGANLAVIAAADEMIGQVENPPACLVLLSPGADYHGVRPVPRAHDLGGMPVLIISASADGQSYSGSEALGQAARGSEFHPMSGRAHGTDLFESEENLLGDVANWLHEHLTATPAPPAEEAEEVEGENEEKGSETESDS